MAYACLEVTWNGLFDLKVSLDLMTPECGFHSLAVHIKKVFPKFSMRVVWVGCPPFPGGGIFINQIHLNRSVNVGMIYTHGV